MLELCGTSLGLGIDCHGVQAVELGAGEHTLELWLRGNATECTNNPGNFGHSIVAMEVQSNS